MKHLMALTAMVFLLFSCQKEMGSGWNEKESTHSFFQKVKAQLKDSLSAKDYSALNLEQLFKSKDAQSRGYFVRGAFQNKSLATDFVLLRTDSLGNISEGKIIHVEKTNSKENTAQHSFQGQFMISSLNRLQSTAKEVINGRWNDGNTNTSLLEEPVGEQTLPEVVVTSYSTTGDNTGDWYCYDDFYDDGYSGDGSEYTYGYSGGGGSGSAGTSTSENNDNTMDIEIESNDDPPIKVDDYTKCFNNVPDANAVYQITLFADIPVNGDPSELFNVGTGSVGHSFIQLSKSSGTTIVQQNIGFYPETGWKSLSSASVASKVVDNGGHEFNASLTTSISNTEFQAALTELQSISSRDYNIGTWNCTDFALDIFNVASGSTLSIPKFQLPGTYTYSSTPQALFDTIQNLNNAGNDSYGTTEIPGICGYVGNSHGSCGN